MKTVVKDCIKELEWRVWHGGNHSKCGRFVVLPEGKMFRLTHAIPDVKSDRLVKQSCLYTSREIAMEQANALHQNEILGWLDNGIADLTGGKDDRNP